MTTSSLQTRSRGFLRTSISEGFSILISLDANEHMKLGGLAMMFRYLVEVESITTITSAQFTGSHVKGSEQTDGIWTSVNISVKIASFCQFNFIVGNHMIILVNIDKSSLLGSAPAASPPTKTRILISSNSEAGNLCISYAKSKHSYHKILPKHHNLTQNW